MKLVPIQVSKLSCGDMTFSVCIDDKGYDSPILFIKDEEKIIKSFSNKLAIRFALENIDSLRVVLVAVKIEDSIYTTNINYCTDIGSRFMKSIVRNPLMTVAFMDENNKSHNALQTSINKNKDIDKMVTRLKILTPWSEENYELCKEAFLKSFPSIDAIWGHLSQDNRFKRRSLLE